MTFFTPSSGSVVPTRMEKNTFRRGTKLLIFGYPCQMKVVVPCWLHCSVCKGCPTNCECAFLSNDPERPYMALLVEGKELLMVPGNFPADTAAMWVCVANLPFQNVGGVGVQWFPRAFVLLDRWEREFFSILFRWAICQHCRAPEHSRSVTLLAHVHYVCQCDIILLCAVSSSKTIRFRGLICVSHFRMFRRNRISQLREGSFSDLLKLEYMWV